MEITLEIRPNNQVKVGVQSIHCTPKKCTDSTSTLAREQVDRIMSVSHLEVIEGYRARVLTGLSTLDRFQTVSSSDAEFWQKRQSASLDFISEFQHVCKRYARKRRSNVGYGELGKGTSFSRFARSKMLAAGAVLEDKYTEPGRSVLVTLTVPGNHKDARDVVPRYSGYIMNRLMQIIRRAQSGREKQDQTDWLYCWEYQRRSFLHLHLAISDPFPGVAEMLGHDIKDKWLQLLSELSEVTGKSLFTHRSGKFCWMPHLWQNDVSVVRKSVACYLSKYVSKGVDTGKGKLQQSKTYVYPVARWWGMSRLLSRAVESASSKLTVSALTEDVASSVMCAVVTLLRTVGVTSEYGYSFDIEGGRTHIGSGNRQILYVSPDKFAMVATTLGSYVRGLLGNVSGRCVKGKNWLLADYGFDNVELPDYYLRGVTTIKKPSYGTENQVCRQRGEA